MKICNRVADALAGVALVCLAGCGGGHEHHDHGEEGHDHEEEIAQGHEHSEDDGHDHEAAGIHFEGDGHDHGHEGEDKTLIELPKEQGEKFGVVSTKIAGAPFAEVLKVSGQLTGSPSDQGTVTARSAGIVTLARGIAEGSHVNRGQTVATVSGRGMAGGDSNEAAQVALKAAKRELDRLTPLHDDGIVTTEEFNAAQERYDAARIAASGTSKAGSAASAPVSGSITALLVQSGQFVEAGQPIAEVSGSNSVALRADVPESRYGFLTQIAGAKFRPSYSDDVIDIKELNGRRTSGASTVAQGGVLPVWFALQNHDGRAVNGAYCDVYLLGKERQGVLSVPVEAISEQQGRHFVYTLVKEGHYKKMPVELGTSDGQRVEILSGLPSGSEVVVKGTTFVRLAETSKIAPPGHSHNH